MFLLHLGVHRAVCTCGPLVSSEASHGHVPGPYAWCNAASVQVCQVVVSVVIEMCIMCFVVKDDSRKKAG